MAFSDRGDGDYYDSHDLEDFITVIDGRDNIVAEVSHTFSNPAAQLRDRIGAPAHDRASLQ